VVAGFWQWVLDPGTWGTGIGGTALGLVTGHFKTNRGRISKLEAEVHECRKRDADLHVVKAGVRLLVGEMVRDNPNSQALKMFGDLLAQKLGPAPTIDEFADLLKQADEADPDDWGGPRRNTEGNRD
jgi:hypothetical protein